MAEETERPGGETRDAERNQEGHRVPWWMIVIIIICALPGLGFPWFGELFVAGDLTVRGLTWFYPLYTAVSALLAWQCYGRRTTLTWIILILLLMSHFCFYYLAGALASTVSYK